MYSNEEEEIMLAVVDKNGFDPTWVTESLSERWGQTVFLTSSLFLQNDNND